MVQVLARMFLGEQISTDHVESVVQYHWDDPSQTSGLLLHQDLQVDGEGDPCERAVAIGLPEPLVPETNRGFFVREADLVHRVLLELSSQSSQVWEERLPAIRQKSRCSPFATGSHCQAPLASLDLEILGRC